MEQAWERSRKHRLGYLRRRPEETLLYRIIYNYHLELERCWEERFQAHYGVLRDAVLRAFDRYLSCGIVAHGCARARCEKCNHSILIAFSCKRRGLCPACDAKRAILFAEHLHNSVLLPFPYRHVVWSIPKRLRIYFRFDRKLIGKLYLAAWQAWGDIVGNTGTTGAIMAIHCTGDTLQFHPHIHSLCLDGTVNDAAQFTQHGAVDIELLQEYFADNVLALLLEAELISQDVVDQIRSQEHWGFNVWLGEPIPTADTEQRLFIARYLKRAPLALDRMSLIEGGAEPIIRIVKHLDDGDVYRDLSPLDFLAELQQAIPDTWEQTTRYYGLHASRTRGAQPVGFRTQLSENTALSQQALTWSGTMATRAILLLRHNQLKRKLFPQCRSNQQSQSLKQVKPGPLVSSSSTKQTPYNAPSVARRCTSLHSSNSPKRSKKSLTTWAIPDTARRRRLRITHRHQQSCRFSIICNLPLSKLPFLSPHSDSSHKLVQKLPPKPESTLIIRQEAPQRSIFAR